MSRAAVATLTRGTLIQRRPAVVVTTRGTLQTPVVATQPRLLRYVVIGSRG